MRLQTNWFSRMMEPFCSWLDFTNALCWVASIPCWENSPSESRIRYRSVVWFWVLTRRISATCNTGLNSVRSASPVVVRWIIAPAVNSIADIFRRCRVWDWGNLVVAWVGFGEWGRWRDFKTLSEKLKRGEWAPKRWNRFFFDFCSAGENYTPTYGLPTPSQSGSTNRWCWVGTWRFYTVFAPCDMLFSKIVFFLFFYFYFFINSQFTHIRLY